ncbi:hypothetical protein BH10PSE12_BH10PSE12_07530 [soil metagenome]
MPFCKSLITQQYPGEYRPTCHHRHGPSFSNPINATAITLITTTPAARPLMRPVAVRSFLPGFRQWRRVLRCSAGPHGAFRITADDMVCDEARLVDIRHRVARNGETDLRAIITLRR